MGVYKSPLFLLTAIMLAGCASDTNKEQSTGTLEASIAAPGQLCKEALMMGELMDKVYTELNAITVAVNEVNTNDIMFENLGREKPYDDDLLEDAATKIERIKGKIASQEQTLERYLAEIQTLKARNRELFGKSSLSVKGLRAQIDDLKEAIFQKEEIIYQLQQDNVQLKREQERLISENRIQQETIEAQKHQIVNLNRKGVLIISKKDAYYESLAENIIRLSYDLSDIELITEHSKAAYNIQEFSNSVHLHIINPSLFWENSQIAVFRIKKRHL